MMRPVGWIVLVCLAGCRRPASPHEVTFVGSDYAFQGPDTVAAGPTIFRFKNAGSVAHELSLSVLRPGVTGQQAFAAEMKGADVDSIYESDGLLFVPAGDQLDMGLLVDLEPGRQYVLICALESGPRKTVHAQLGMFKHVIVR